uniref:LCI fold-containing protein n=1 Tax=Aequorivita echinoideorum TaxID=1549647 RepID=UPI003898DEA6
MALAYAKIITDVKIRERMAIPKMLFHTNLFFSEKLTYNSNPVFKSSFTKSGTTYTLSSSFTKLSECTLVSILLL